MIVVPDFTDVESEDDLNALAAAHKLKIEWQEIFPVSVGSGGAVSFGLGNIGDLKSVKQNPAAGALVRPYTTITLTKDHS